MKSNKGYNVAIASTFIWIGFLCAISFMEAWLKFRAPGVTIEIGLGIGKLVFGALNKVEIVLSIIILFNLLVNNTGMPFAQKVYFYVAFVIVILETFWALPALDKIANLVIQDRPLPASNLHIYYVVMEVIKLGCLILFGLYLLNKKSSISLKK